MLLFLPGCRKDTGETSENANSLPGITQPIWRRFAFAVTRLMALPRISPR